MSGEDDFPSGTCQVHVLLGRREVVVSYRTLHRYATTELGFGQERGTVRIAVCEPGAEV